MDTEMLTTLFTHFTWARDRLLDAAAGLTAEQLRAADVPGGYGSIHDTFAHMAASEWMWLARIGGQSPTPPGGSDFADLTAIRAWWDEEHARTLAYLRGLTPGELQRVIVYRNAEGREFRRRVWHALLHIANHQTEHRAQIAALLTHYGIAPPPTDLVVFLPADGT
jgi:uncharacterized damage-inducible protein DinB